MLPISLLNGADPARQAPEQGQAMTAPKIARRTVPWPATAGSSSPRGLHDSHIAVPSGTVAPQRTQPWVSSVAAGVVGVTRSWCHDRPGPSPGGAGPPTLAPGGYPATAAAEPALQRSVAATAHRRRRSSERSRWPRRHRPPASGPRLAGRLDPWAPTTLLSPPSQSAPCDPTSTRWSARRASGRLECLEIGRQVLLEVVVEGRPAVADAAGEPGPGPRLATDDDRRRRVRPDIDLRIVERVERRRPADRTPSHSARSTATASSSRATRSGASGNGMPSARCSSG